MKFFCYIQTNLGLMIIPGMPFYIYICAKAISRRTYVWELGSQSCCIGLICQLVRASIGQLRILGHAVIGFLKEFKLFIRYSLCVD
jgi:hypothetical protein